MIKFDRTPMLKYMQEHKLSQRAFADKANISRCVISDMFCTRCNYNPSLFTAYKIAKTIGIPIESFILKTNT